MTHNPQPHANNSPDSIHTDARIDHVLHALRSTEPAPGIEARIAERIAAQHAVITKQATTPPHPGQFFAVVLNAVRDAWTRVAPAMRYTSVAASLAAVAALILFSTITAITLFHHHPPNSNASAAPIPNQALSTQAPQALSTRVPLARNARAPLALNAQVPQGFSLGSHTILRKAGVLTPASTPLPPTDPDAIALAETLAPSHPAPPMPLTRQERLLLAVMRKGQPIEIAELDIARASSLRAAANARETAGIQQFARKLFAPIALAEALEPAPTQPQEDLPPAPVTPPLSSN